MVASAPDFPVSARPRAPKVLLVDDDALVLRSIARALSNTGLKVVSVDDPNQALRMLGEEEFDAVLCDIGMPQMSGLTFARFVRAKQPDVPVMLMTGDPRLDSAIEGIHVGVHEYLPKPIEVAKLRAVVSRAVNLGRLARVRREAMDIVGSDGPSSQSDALHEALDRALASLHVAFQPLVDSTKSSIFGYEALLRSKEPSLPNPPAVIAAAEQLGRTDEVGARVRDLACDAFASAPEGTLLFLNIIPLDLLAQELYERDSKIGRLAHRIVLEMTERADLARVKDALPRIQRLREIGFRIAVDDLGAGYAGLSSFTALEPEFTKLDMSLVRNVDASPVKQRVIGSIVSLCRDLGSRVVAEGIETKEERAVLEALGCDIMQGYHFAKPGPPFPECKF